MKSDLDTLMQSKNLDAILVLGSAEHNPPMTFLVGGGHVSHAVLIKKLNQEPVLFCNAMEREEAAKSGLNTVPLRRSPIAEFSDRYEELFGSYGVTSGRVGVYGRTDISETLLLLDLLRSTFPRVSFFGETPSESIFMRAMETKEENTVGRIRRMGRITTEVVGVASAPWF